MVGIERNRITEEWMLKGMRRLAGGGVLLAGCLLSMVQAGHGQSSGGQKVSAVAKLDMNRYMGNWYEVARLPNKAETDCVSDAIVLLAPASKPNRYMEVDSCLRKDGTTNARNGNMKPTDKSGDGRLKVSYLWPFYKKRWVLGVGENYEWALIGSPDHKTLWVLSRTAAAKPGAMAQIGAKAAANGFDVSKLVMMSRGEGGVVPQ